jgi:hypothetical protein
MHNRDSRHLGARVATPTGAVEDDGATSIDHDADHGSPVDASASSWGDGGTGHSPGGHRDIKSPDDD